MTPRPNVVLLVFDTLRADALSCYDDDAVETPNLDRIAESGTRFESAFSAGAWTPPAHGTLFSGLWPSNSGFQGNMPTMDDDVPLLADRLRDAGYDTYGVSGPSKMASPTNLDRGFDWYYEPWDHVAERPSVEWFEQLLTDDSVRRDTFRLFTRGNDYYNELRIEKFLDALGGAESPFFGMMNLTTVHAPYDPPRPYKTDRTPSLSRPPLHVFEELLTPGRIEDDSVRDERVFAVADGKRSNNIRFRYYDDDSYVSDEELAIVREWYRASVEYLDDQVGRILGWFDERNLTDDTVFVLTSDHGEYFGEHGLLYHSVGLYDEVLRVPLIFAGPGVPTGSRREDLASLADVFATVCALSDVEAPETDGIDLFGPERRDHVVAERAYTEHGNPEAESEVSEETLAWMRVGRKSIRTEDYRLELRSDGSSSLYRLPSQEEVVDPDPDVVSDLRDRLTAEVDDEFNRGDGDGDEREYSDAVQRNLRDLGYLG
ncbi:sulfatase [Halopelagius fulvigenes]|uniref:Sulfatase n=1 Tax=Halopelagius fulvigenes TaxID=1198324 RepID=A0ABD5TYA8_9EURY